jgi:hypothetical protein
MSALLPAAEPDSPLPELSRLYSERVFIPPAPSVQSTLAGWTEGLAAYGAAQTELRSRHAHARAIDDPGSVFGWTTVSEANDGGQLTATTIVQDLTSNRGGPPLAIASVFLRGVEADQRIFFTVLLEGTPAETNVQVHTLGGAIAGGVSAMAIGPLAGTFWQRFVTCLRGGCAGTCLGSIGTCAGKGGGWAAVLACIAVACGGCALRCSACAACDCSWWCRWAAGCCRP